MSCVSVDAVSVKEKRGKLSVKKKKTYILSHRLGQSVSD